MGAEIWEMKTLDVAPYQGTKIYCCNDGEDKRIFVVSNYYYTLYVRLWCDDNNDKVTETTLFGVAGFYVPSDYRHRQIQIGTSTDKENWHWTIHNYHNGGTK